MSSLYLFRPLSTVLSQTPNVAPISKRAKGTAVARATRHHHMAGAAQANNRLVSAGTTSDIRIKSHNVQQTNAQENYTRKIEQGIYLGLNRPRAS